MQKISPEKKQQIVNERLTGLSYGKIALKFNVSQSIVYFICNPEKLDESVKNRPKKSREANDRHVKNYRAKLKSQKSSNSTHKKTNL